MGCTKPCSHPLPSILTHSYPLPSTLIYSHSFPSTLSHSYPHPSSSIFPPFLSSFFSRILFSLRLQFIAFYIFRDLREAIFKEPISVLISEYGTNSRDFSKNWYSKLLIFFINISKRKTSNGVLF